MVLLLHLKRGDKGMLCWDERAVDEMDSLSLMSVHTWKMTFGSHKYTPVIKPKSFLTSVRVIIFSI